VVTLNVWGRRGDWAARRAVLAEGLRRVRPDLVAFVEAIKTEEFDQAADLLGPGYHLAHQREREADRGSDVEDGQGASIASRWPLGEVREVDLHVTPRTTDFAATTLIAEVHGPDHLGTFLFANHVPNWQLDFERERELQAVAAARNIEGALAGRTRHVVLAGDLTADPDSASVRFWTGRQSLEGMSVCYRDAWESANPTDPGHTFTPLNPLMGDRTRDWPSHRLDYIMVRCTHDGPTLDIRSCRRIFDQPVGGVWATDHFGLVAELAPPES
jgi:endonuclease/exonuclease/phosphatase family metal-dependent hydrolase